MAARVLAALAAVAMVAGALAVRANLDDKDERSSTTLRLVCATELGAVCDTIAATPGSRVEVTVEPAGETADRLGQPGPGSTRVDGWLAAAPWAEIVTERRASNGLGPIFVSGEPLARSPVVLAVAAGKLDALKGQCGGDPGWKCLGEAAGKRWADLPEGSLLPGQVKPGHPPVATLAGLTVVGAATAGYFGTTDLSLTELEDAGFREWLRRLEAAAPDLGSSPFLTMLSRPSAFDAVGALEAEAGPAHARATGSKPVLLYPSPVATADVVLLRTRDRAGELLEELVSSPRGGQALVDHGWRVAGMKPIRGVDPSVTLPAGANLPPGGALEALRQRVAQISR